MTGARRLRNGVLRPWVVDYMAGREEQDRLRQQGLDLDLTGHELHALGVAMAEQRGEGHDPAPDLTPSAELMDMIEQIAQARARPPAAGHELDQVHDQDQAQARPAPELHPRTAEDPAVGLDRGLDLGRGVHAERGHQQNYVRNILSERFDPPDDDWS